MCTHCIWHVDLIDIFGLSLKLHAHICWISGGIKIMGERKDRDWVGHSSVWVVWCSMPQGGSLRNLNIGFVPMFSHVTIIYLERWTLLVQSSWLWGNQTFARGQYKQRVKYYWGSAIPSIAELNKNAKRVEKLGHCLVVGKAAIRYKRWCYDSKRESEIKLEQFVSLSMKGL